MKDTSQNREIIRFEPSLKYGLNNDQISQRKEEKLVNTSKRVVGKSNWEIIRTNVLSLFNILLFVLAGLLIYGKYYDNLFFLFILIPNIIIGLYEDFHAKSLLKKLRLLTQPKSKVLRNGVEEIIETDEIVLDDIMILSSGAQICADGIVLDGTLLVNESLLTGEADLIEKKKGDIVFSGSFVVSGNAYALADKVGKDSYIETLNNKANKFKRSASEILKSLRYIFRVVGGCVIVLGIATIILYAVQGSLSNNDEFIISIKPIAGSLIAMIPAGLYLLTSLALAVAVISLAKKRAQVQDFYSIEMLARANVLCVDKTGTITDGTMKVKKVMVLDNIKEEDLAQVVSDTIQATQDDNLTSQALKAYFTYKLSKRTDKVLPFNSDNKYSAATFAGGFTYAIGAPDFLPITNKSVILKLTNEYTCLGYRVLVVATGDAKIEENSLQGTLKGIGIIVLEDHIRDSAIKTFGWFKDNGVNIKVISGDDANTVSEIARQAGIENAEKCISLEGMNVEQVKLCANNYTVFGRVNPEQKEALVLALKDEGKTVAMTGDGVNDILALKRADCSIAMASGSDAARNVSHIVLLDSDFASLPKVVAEGRRVINNLQRTASLFLSKPAFAVFFSLLFLLISLISGNKSIRYPFTPNNLYIWEICCIGLASFFIALQPNSEQIKGSFLKNVIIKFIPAAISMIFAVGMIMIAMLLQKNGILYTAVYPDVIKDGEIIESTYISMCTIVISIMSLVILYKVCEPFDRYRKIVFVSFCALAVLLLCGSAILSLNGNVPNIFDINFEALGPMNYILIVIDIIISTALYFTICNIYNSLKGGNIGNENK